jgi:HlyD family secretion protein
MIKNKKIITIIIFVIALVMGFCMFNSKKVKYITRPVTQETITETVEASGSIKPINTIAVGTQVSGTVARLYVDFNSVVKKGDLLAELDPSLFQSNVDQSTAKLNNAKASLSRATASLNYKKIIIKDTKTFMQKTMYQKMK